MTRLQIRTTIAAVAAILSIALAQPGSAQPPSGQIYRLFGDIQAVTLAQLDEVATALELKDEQKSELSKLNDALNTDRFEAFQDAAGDFDAMREEVAKLHVEYNTKAAAALDEAQQQRAEEIYVQINGPTALNSKTIAEKLKITEEQKKKLADASINHLYDVFDSFQDMQDMSEAERAKAVEGMIESRDKSLLAVLSDEQKAQFEKMAGDKLEVDLNKLPRLGQR